MIYKVLHLEAVRKVNDKHKTKKNSSERNNTGNNNDSPTTENRLTLGLHETCYIRPPTIAGICKEVSTESEQNNRNKKQLGLKYRM